ncbi:hypothetical protein [Streptomyces sp. NPDC048256]|uniref:hypothetical protein n=1 Tax=unclassified Streptomyces TaxID=2593676 RepID=UPI0033C4B2E9
MERDERGARQAAVVDVDASVPLTLGVTVAGAEAQFWYLRGGVRTPVGPPLDAGRLSDDHGDRLRFTGTLAGFHARDPSGTSGWHAYRHDDSVPSGSSASGPAGMDRLGVPDPVRRPSPLQAVRLRFRPPVCFRAAVSSSRAERPEFRKFRRSRSRVFRSLHVTPRHT